MRRVTKIKALSIQAVSRILLIAALPTTIASSAEFGKSRCFRPADGSAEVCLERLGRGGGHSDAETERSEASFRAPFPGIHTRDYRRNGWWQDGPPVFGSSEPLAYEDLAISGDACQVVREGHLAFDGSGWVLDSRSAEWRIKNVDRCAVTGMRPAHVYLATFPGHFNDYVELLYKSDPWARHPELSSRVHVLIADSDEITPDERSRLKRMRPGNVEFYDTSPRGVHALQERLLERCQVIRHVSVAGHGAPGHMDFGETGHTTTSFLRSVLSPCLMAPGAKIQLNGCGQVDSWSYEATLKGLRKVYLEPEYRSRSGRPALHGLEILMPTTLSTTIGYFRGQIGHDGKPKTVLTTRSKNDLAVVFRVGAGDIFADTPLHALERYYEKDVLKHVDSVKTRLEALENAKVNIRTTRIRPEPAD